MSDDLIKRSDAIKVVWGEDIDPSEDGVVFEAQSHVDRDIRLILSADRPQGEWIDKGDYAECSKCGAKSGTQYNGVEPVPFKSKFCSNCGAKMKG